jgi:hypothetical protein
MKAVVAIDVMGAGVVEIRIARRRNMNHRRHLELAQLLVDRVPMHGGERRVGPVAARRVGVQVDADETELVHDAFELRNAVRGRCAGKLRQLSDTDEIVGQQLADAMNEVVGDRRPLHADRLGADVMRHRGGARRKNREIAAAVFLHLQLRLNAFHQNVVADRRVS